MTTLRERLAQMGETAMAAPRTLPWTDAHSAFVLHFHPDVAAALVAVADAAAQPSAYDVAAEEVYRLLRWYSNGIISQAHTDHDERELRSALAAFEMASAARGPTREALDALAAALGVSR